MSEIKGKLKEYKIDRLNDYIYELASWCYNVNGDEYMKEMHDRTEETDHGDYAVGKFRYMQKDFVWWYGGLDAEHRRRLAKIIWERRQNRYEQDRQRQDN